MCGDVRYETVQSERIINEAGTPTIIGRMHYCKGCGVLFRDPYLFNAVKPETGNEERGNDEW